MRRAFQPAAAGVAAALAAGCGSPSGTPADQQSHPPPAPHIASPPDPETAGGAPDEEAGPPPADLVLTGELAEALKLIELRQTDAARQRLERYLQEHPEDGRAEFLTGLSFHREKRYAQARPHFEKARALEPAYHPTHHFLGWCLYYLGQAQPAREAFEAHLSYRPLEGDSHFAIGLIDLEEDRLDEAERRFRRAIALQADLPARRKDVSKAHARLADVHIRRGELDQAKAELQIATTMWPQHYAAFYKLSVVLTRLGELEAAREAFQLYELWQQRMHPPRGVPEQTPPRGVPEQTP